MGKFNNIVLFDLDGTLTPARGKITDENTAIISELLKHARVGIVTGSTLAYVTEQVGRELFRQGLEVFSCNGTEHWVLENEAWRSVTEPISMREYMGPEWRHMHKILHGMQGDVLDVVPDLPLTGQFVSYRGSMINWCPIGRDADQADRKMFEEIDRITNMRLGLMGTLRDRLRVLTKKLTVKLGGETSFDIYPVGWDKSYVLSRFNDENVWFVGDRCEGLGNDVEIYNALQPHGRAFKVRSPDETPSKVREIMAGIGTHSDEFFSPPY
jgi:phosphomannomutase